MIFSSYLFIFFFLPPALLLYFLSPRKLKNGILALVSYVFYGWTNPWFILLMFSTTAVDYTNGRMIGKFPERKRFFLVISLLFDLLILGFFKYFNFGIENYNALVNALGLPEAEFSGFFRVVLPLGISFYTFQSMSYVIDVYRETAAPVKSFADYACYVSMFPQLVAGPIIRFTEVAKQLESRFVSWEKFARGIAFFMLGMGKKVLLANPCGKIADYAFAALDLPITDAWFGVISYAFQIYFDFSGYSDMAVGLGLMLGFVFPKNFDSPFRSQSMPEYWRRWHISLSVWLKDYLFFPLLRSNWCIKFTQFFNNTGHKKLAKTIPVSIALVIFWFIVGLWHGSAWTFIVFGLYHGLFIIADVIITANQKRKKETKEEQRTMVTNKLISILRIMMTFVFACFGFVFFRADSLSDAGHYFASLFGCPQADQLSGTVIRAITSTPYYAGVFIISGTIIWTMPQVWDFTKKLTLPKIIWCAMIFFLSILALSVQSYNPFIYFIF